MQNAPRQHLLRANFWGGGCCGLLGWPGGKVCFLGTWTQNSNMTIFVAWSYSGIVSGGPGYCWIEMNRKGPEVTLGSPSHLTAEGGACLATGLGRVDHAWLNSFRGRDFSTSLLRRCPKKGLEVIFDRNLARISTGGRGLQDEKKGVWTSWKRARMRLACRVRTEGGVQKALSVSVFRMHISRSTEATVLAA